jgi:hypothetical protein
MVAISKPDTALVGGGVGSPFIDPEYQTACLTKVDFSPFLALKAKIDRIDFRGRGNSTEMTPKVVRMHQAKLSGRFVKPKAELESDVRGRGMAIHDPTLGDLQYLMNLFYDAQILRFELAVDARLPPGSNELWRLQVLKAQLRHCLYPQQHKTLEQARRKSWDDTKGKNGNFRNDGLKPLTPHNMGQIIWEAPGWDKLALYVKDFDQGNRVERSCVRMEARLFTQGLQRAGLQRLGMLRHFAPKLRADFSDMFFIASGFKNNDEIAVGRGIPKDPWSPWGAQWKFKHFDAKLRPDSAANVLVGAALGNLRTELSRLKPPAPVAHRYADWVEENTY